MASVDARGLHQQLKDGKIANVYYLYGSDVLQVEQSVKRIVKYLTGSTDSDGVTKLDGTKLDLSYLAEEAELCPMFADYNCILIHDCNLETMTDEARKTLLGIVKEVAPSTVLIFYVTGFDIYGGKTGKNKKPTPKNLKLVELIGKNGVVCVHEPKTPAAMATEVVASAKKRGCSISREAAQLLAVQCSCQTLLLKQELDKLCAYVDGGEITEAMVQEMVTPQLETTVYALTRAVLRRNAHDAMRAVDELLALRLDMHYLLGTLTGAFIDLQRAAAARQSGRTVQDMVQDFSYRFSFSVENAFRDSAGYELAHIAACLQLLCETERRLHSQAVDERVLFEQTIVQMLQR